MIFTNDHCCFKNKLILMGLSPSSDRISIIIAFIINSILCIQTIISNIKSRELCGPAKNTTTSKLIVVRIYCTVLTVIFCIAIFCCSIAFPFESSFLYVISIGNWLLLKIGFWTYNISRLEGAFAGSPFEYSRAQIILLSIFLTINAILLSFICHYIGMYLGFGFEFEILPAQIRDLCVVKTSLWLTCIIGACESSANIVLFWLFYRKIKVLQDMENDPEIAFATKKYAILIVLSMISTWTSLLLSTFMNICLTVSTIDSVMNLCCLLLYDAKLNGIYMKIFACCHKQSDLYYIYYLLF